MKKQVPTQETPEKHRDFFNDVFDVVRQIPSGRVTSYGAIAAFLGTKSSSRMVGWAMNTAHGRTPPIPAHRVVNRQGLLTGRAHFSPPELMEQLLKAEGIVVKDNAVQNFEEYFWDPANEIKL